MTVEQRATLKRLLRVSQIVIFIAGPHGTEKKTL